MADKTPNYTVEMKRQQIEIGTMKLNLERMDLRILEIEDEKIKIAENREATEKEIVNMQTNLAKMRESEDFKANQK